jgi:AhpC/TSA family protein
VTGLWVVSYVALWGLVVAIGLLMVGILRQMGILQHQLAVAHGPGTLPAPGVARDTPALEDDGPEIGSRIPTLRAETLNGFGTVAVESLRDDAGTLLVFMSPMCEGCQHMVEPLNALVDAGAHRERMIAILHADEQASRAFMNVFPLRIPVICDADRTFTMGLGIHRNPFGLLYDVEGRLVRKGMMTTQGELLAVLGDVSAPAAALEFVFPRAQPTSPAPSASGLDGLARTRA